MEEETRRTVEPHAEGQRGKLDARVIPPFPGTNVKDSRHPSTSSPPVRQAFPLWDIRRTIYIKITQPRQEEEAKNTERSESPEKHLLLCCNCQQGLSKYLVPARRNALPQLGSATVMGRRWFPGDPLLSSATLITTISLLPFFYRQCEYNDVTWPRNPEGQL